MHACTHTHTHTDAKAHYNVTKQYTSLSKPPPFGAVQVTSKLQLSTTTHSPCWREPVCPLARPMWCQTWLGWMARQSRGTHVGLRWLQSVWGPHCAPVGTGLCIWFCRTLAAHRSGCQWTSVSGNMCLAASQVSQRSECLAEVVLQNSKWLVLNQVLQRGECLAECQVLQRGELLAECQVLQRGKCWMSSSTKG